MRTQRNPIASRAKQASENPGSSPSRDADVLVIATEWNQFRMLNLERVRSLLRRPVIADLRNIYEPESMRAAGFEYVSVGR